MSYQKCFGLTEPLQEPQLGETPFSLAYGYEAMLPVEIGASSLRRENYDSNQNFILQRQELDLLEEKRRDSQLWVAAY